MMWQNLAMTLDFQSSRMKGDKKVSAFVLSSLSVHGSGAFSYLLLSRKDLTITIFWTMKY